MSSSYILSYTENGVSQRLFYIQLSHFSFGKFKLRNIPWLFYPFKYLVRTRWFFLIMSCHEKPLCWHKVYSGLCWDEWNLKRSKVKISIPLCPCLCIIQRVISQHTVIKMQHLCCITWYLEGSVICMLHEHTDVVTLMPKRCAQPCIHIWSE